MNIYWYFLFFILLFGEAMGQNNLPNKTKQILVVTTDGWDTIHGKLNVYNQVKGKWKSIMPEIPVTIGRKGLAWGKGLHNEKLIYGYVKKEGDGRSPAGIFPLNELFGYGDMSTKMKYIKSDKNTYCVDDPSSLYYNQIVNTDTVKKDWNSAEDMLLKSNSYKYGIVVGYNSNPAIPGNGSCVFIHIWGNNNTPTSGCTAMTEANILKLFSLLEKDKSPLIVQVPEVEYKKMKALYKLP